MTHHAAGHDKPLTLLFDLGNVLFPFDWDVAVKGFSEMLKRSKAETWKTFKEADYSILFYEFGTGRMSTERFVNKLNELLGSNLSLEVIASKWCSIFREDKKMMGLLRKVSRRYRTFILSDTDALHWNYLDEIHGLEDTITGAILSFRYGNMKSDPGAFEKIIRAYRFDPATTCFVDDLEKNIHAAEKAGIHGILHRSYAETVEALKKFGVEI